MIQPGHWVRRAQGLLVAIGAVLLHRIQRMVIGENRNFQGRENWLREAGAEIVNYDDPRCTRLMRDFIVAHPELWDEDIGVPARG